MKTMLQVVALALASASVAAAQGNPVAEREGAFRKEWERQKQNPAR